MYMFVRACVRAFHQYYSVTTDIFKTAFNIYIYIYIYIYIVLVFLLFHIEINISKQSR